jgi:hypothetical protein
LIFINSPFRKHAPGAASKSQSTKQTTDGVNVVAEKPKEPKKTETDVERRHKQEIRFFQQTSLNAICLEVRNSKIIFI